MFHPILSNVVSPPNILTVTSTQIWKLSANDMIDDDVIDSDLVLEPTDLVKPSADSLLAPKCGLDAATKKKRACKNCTCGLAEELAGGQEAPKDLPKSSCGSVSSHSFSYSLIHTFLSCFMLESCSTTIFCR